MSSVTHQIEMLENFKKYAEKAGVREIEVCSGCGKEGCDSCPCGTSYVVRNELADKLKKALAHFGVTDVDKFLKGLSHEESSSSKA
jgi:hypothetical protein